MSDATITEKGAAGMAMREDVRFRAGDGTELLGWHYRPDAEDAGSAKRRPVVIMTHGYGAVKEMYLNDVATVLADGGLACLVYDHRGLGASGGTVRQELDPHMQASDMRDAITFARTLRGVDADRIGLWGTSFSGGHALFVAATDRRIGAVFVQVPTISGSENTWRRYAGDAIFDLRSRLAADRDSRGNGDEPGVLALVNGWEPSDLEIDSAPVFVGNDQQAWMKTIPRHRTRSWRNELTLRSVELYSTYEPGVHIAAISPTPLMLVCMTQDTVVNTDQVLAAYNHAAEPKSLVLRQGGHFDVYGVYRQELAAVARDHFLSHLG